MRHGRLTFGLSLAVALVASGCYQSHLLPEPSRDSGTPDVRDSAVPPDAPPDASPDASPDAGPPFEEDLSDLIDATCRRVVECDGPITYASAGDCEDIIKRLTWGVLVPLWKEGVADGTLDYQPGRIAACIAAASAASCEDFLTSLWLCDIFTGHLEPGQPCRDHQECAGDAYCPQRSTLDSDCNGTCVARAAEGETCSEEPECQRGLHCTRDSVCVPNVSPDGCRAPDNGCGIPEFTCIGDSATHDGVCGPYAEAFRLPIGATCDPEFEDYCARPAVCALVAGRVGIPDAVYRCVAPYESSGPCRTGFPDGCPSGQYCAIDPFALADVLGVCMPLPGVGVSCAPYRERASLVCERELACDRGTCAVPAGLGEPCDIAEGCLSRHCEGSVCVLAQRATF